MDPTNITAFAFTAVALWAKGMLTSAAQVIFRVRSRSLVRPEDARMLKVMPAAAEDARVTRLDAVWRNELEATPATITLAGAYVLAGGDAAAFVAALITFVAARYAQGISQYAQLQPARTVSWLIGVAASGFIALLLVSELLG